MSQTAIELDSQDRKASSISAHQAFIAKLRAEYADLSAPSVPAPYFKQRMIMPLAIATTAVASEESPVRLALNVARPNASVAAEPSIVASTSRGHLMMGWLEDAGLLLLLVLAFPVVILIAGAPVALVVRLLIEIGRRLW
jgi:hypothetical protein